MINLNLTGVRHVLRAKTQMVAQAIPVLRARLPSKAVLARSVKHFFVTLPRGMRQMLPSPVTLLSAAIVFVVAVIVNLAPAAQANTASLRVLESSIPRELLLPVKAVCKTFQHKTPTKACFTPPHKPHVKK